MPPIEGQPPAYRPPVKPLKSVLKKPGSPTQGDDPPAEPGPPPREDEFLALTKRFEALKKR